jgi:hypothetical protein
MFYQCESPIAVIVENTSAANVVATTRCCAMKGTNAELKTGHKTHITAVPIQTKLEDR